MGVRFIYGMAGSGKSSKVYEEIQKDLKSNQKIYLITPEQFSFTAEQKLLEELKVEAVMQAEVLTFQRMAYRFIKESKYQEKETLSISAKAMIIYSVLSNEKKNLKFLGKSNENIDLVQKQMKEFKKHGVTVSDLQQVVSTEEDPYLKAKIMDILRIYEAYEKKIQKEYFDEDDLLSILLELMEGKNAFAGTKVYIDEFAGFTKQEYRIITQLMKEAEDITITICLEKPILNQWEIDEADLFFESQKTLERLLQIAKEQGIQKIEYIETKNSRFCSKELEHLSQNIYAVPHQVYSEKVKDISIFLANNSYTEIEYVAEKIIELVRDKGYRYKEIGLITKDLTHYSDLCRVILERYHIPYFIDEKHDLTQNILIQYLISILDVFAKNWSYDSVLNYLKMDFVDLEEEDIYLLEEYALKWGIRGSKWYQGDWKILKEQKDPERLLRARNIGILPLSLLKESVVRKPAQEISKEIYRFLIDQNIDQKIETKRKELEEKGRLELADQYKNSWKIVMDLLDEIVILFGDEKIGLEQYMQLFRVGILNRSLGKIPVAQDQVMIGDIDRSKAHPIKAVFIIGLNDGIFPAVYQSEGFLDDKDREKLKGKQIELAKGTKEKLYEDRFLIYQAFSIAEQKLYLSYVSSNLEGVTLRPSVLIGKVKRIFPQLKEESDIVEKKASMINEQVTFDNLLSEIQKQIEGGKDLDGNWMMILDYYQNHPDWQKKLQNAFLGARYTALPEKIKKENIDKLYGDKIQTSISKLEQYSACAFSFYLKYALRLKERKEAQVQAMDTGSFMHDIIDEFLEYIRQEKIELKKIEDVQVKQIVKRLVEEKLKLEKNYIFTINKKYQFLVMRLTKLMNRAILHILDSLRYSEFEILGNEIEFKNGKNYLPIEITLENGKRLEIEGKIDRADVAKTSAGNYIRIIDYKSSVKNLDLNEIEYGLQLQLLTYLDVMCQKEDFMPAGALYFSLIDPVIKADKRMKQDEIEEEIRRRFKMQGFILADVKVVKMMDQNLETGSSNKIPVYLDKEGNISKQRSNCLSKEEFQALQKHIERTIRKIGKEMTEGIIDRKPYYHLKDKKTPCKFCPYRGICQIDSNLGKTSYQYIPNQNKEAVLERLMQKGKEE